MNKIEKLIAELCPEGVEWKKLGEVCEIEDNKRKPVTASKRISGKIPYYGANNIQDYVDGFTHNGEYVLIAEDGSKDLKNYSIQYVSGKFWANNHVHVVKGKEFLLNKFLFYYLKTFNFIPFLTGGERAKLTKQNMLKITIPIPPLPIQEEIVKILDTFTELEAELELKLQAELEVRKKQYEYYRNKLLTPVEHKGRWYLNGVEVEWKKLGEVCEFMNGKGHEKYIDENGRFIVVNSKFISTDGKIKKYSAKQISPVYKYNILMVMSDLPNGKALAKCFYVDENDKYTLNQRICALTIKNFNLLNPKFLLYILNRNKELLKYDNGVDQTNLRKNDILKITIPIPPLSEQERIVAILDKFDALVNDLSQGLPAEIEARRKQYEYYRNRLLTFEPKQ
jgi:type I restriction enzyme S subunit